MSEKDTSEEKTLPPSLKKLRKAREKGQIAHSKEAITAATTAAAFGYLLSSLSPLSSPSSATDC